MVRAYVLMKIEPGKIEDVLGRLRASDHVCSADAVTGPSDVVALVEATDPRDLADLIFRSIQTISGVKETDTRVIIEH
jgi:DNA-binding Lrp family transcriptional regulator